MKHLRSARHRALVEGLTTARHAAELTQRELAKKLKRSGSFVWKFEAGERRLDVLEYIDWCQACGLDPADYLRRLLLRR
jgi:transcriptional regulator with XRE-family HTH domain